MASVVRTTETFTSPYAQRVKGGNVSVEQTTGQFASTNSFGKVTSQYAPKARGGNTISKYNEDGKKTSSIDADRIFASLTPEYFTTDGQRDLTAAWLDY